MKKENLTNHSTPTNSDLLTREVLLLNKKRSFSELFREYWYLSIAAIIPAILFFLIYRARGIYPFGDSTVLVLDLNGQYVYFFEALRNTVLEGGSLLYSWSRALGGEFMGMYAYYIASPLSYLICLFPKDRTQEFLLIMFLIKAALCGGTMGFYLHNHSKNRNKFSVIIFSVMYALSAYCVVHQSNTMWIDAVMWLPLVAFGVERVVKYGRFKTFVIFLALTLASNFYIGYMVCIFVLLYYFFFIIAYKENGVNNPLSEKLHFLKSFVRMGVFSLLAIGIAALIVFCAYYSLQFGKNEFTDPSWEIIMKFDFFDLLFKLLPSSYDTVRIDGLPFVYCGLLAVILAPLFFLCKKIPLRERIASGVFLMIFVLSFMISVTDLIWHGFQKPQWLNARYSFMFCFFLLFLAFRAFEHIKTIKTKHIAVVSGFIFMFVVILQNFSEEFKAKLVALSYGPNEEDFMVHDFATILLAIVCLVAYVSIIAVMKKAKNKDIVAAVLLCVVCGELFFSGLCNVNDFGNDVGFSTYQSYNEFNDLIRPVTDTLHDYDDSFYRFEKTYHRKLNDNMAFSIRGVSNSTSTLNKDTINFLRVLGYYSQSHKSQYKGGTVVSDSLIGMKYIISDRDYSKLYGEPVLTGKDYAEYMGMTLSELQDATFADKYNDYSSDDLNVYLNPYALSLAFASSDDILSVNVKEHNSLISQDSKDYEEKYNPEGYKSPFTRLNAIYSGILGRDVEIFKPAEQLDVDLTNVSYKLSSEHDRYEKIDKNKDGSITYTFAVPDDGSMLYLFLPAYYNREVDLSSSTMDIFDSPIMTGTYKGTLNNSKNSASSFSKCNDRIVELGFSTKDEYKLKVTIDNSYNQFYTKENQPLLYYVDMELFKEVTDTIKKNQLIIDEDYKEDDIKGTITTDNNDQLIYTTIPYDKGWQVYVDGKKVDTFEISEALVGFRIDEAGEHNVRLVYRSNAIVYGAVISALSIILFVLIVIFERKIKALPVVERFFPRLSDRSDNAAENSVKTQTPTDKK